MGWKLEVYTLFLGCKKYIYIYLQMDVIFNIKQIEMECVTFVSTQHKLFIKRVK